MKKGLIEKEKALACYEVLTDENFVCCRSSGGLELGAAAAFLLDAGRFYDALTLYCDRWGAPILAGATTMGEEFFRCSGNSDCHIHGATPARDFLEYLAGIRIAAPGWNEVLLTPPYGLKDLQFRARVPARGAFIEAEVKRCGAEAFYIYEVPQDCICHIRQRDGSIRLGERTGKIDLFRRTQEFSDV